MNMNNTDNKTIYLSFDFDWASNDIINELVDFLMSEDVIATFFITNDFDRLSELREDNRFEVGIHPNFTPLPQDEVYKADFISNAENILNDLLRIVPDAKVVRNHGLTCNTRILNLFVKYGLTHESNIYIPCDKTMCIMPWYHYNGLIRVPYYFEDDLYCEELALGKHIGSVWDVKPYYENTSIRVFDFHPIHFKLNTDSMERYYKYRHDNRVDGNINVDLRGTRDFLKDVIEFGKNNGYRFGKISEIKP